LLYRPPSKFLVPVLMPRPNSNPTAVENSFPAMTAAASTSVSALKNAPTVQLMGCIAAALGTLTYPVLPLNFTDWVDALGPGSLSVNPPLYSPACSPAPTAWVAVVPEVSCSSQRSMMPVRALIDEEIDMRSP